MRGRRKNSRSWEQRRRRCLLAALLLASGPTALAESPVVIAPLPLTIAAGNGNSLGQGGELIRINAFLEPLVAADEANGVVQLTPLPVLDEASPIVQPAGHQVTISSRDADQSGIAYSFSDTASGPVEATIDLGDPAGATVVRSAPVRLQPPAGDRPTRLKAPWPGASAAPAAPAETPAPTLARPAAAGRMIVVPAEDHSDSQVVSAINREPVAASRTPTRLINGARPKVEVVRPPLVVQRERSLGFSLDAKSLEEATQPAPPPETARLAAAPLPALTAPALTAPQVSTAKAAPVARAKPTARIEPAAPGNPPAPAEPAARVASLPAPLAATENLAVRGNLRFKPTEVRALKTDQPIERAETENVAVCAVVKTGPNQVQLIATGVGTTRLTLWTIDQAGNEQRELYELQVADPQTTQADDAQSLAQTLTHSIQAAFPQAHVRVGYRSGRLVLSGVCDDEDSARRIVRMVRSACPMPVDDKLVVRE